MAPHLLSIISVLQAQHNELTSAAEEALTELRTDCESSIRLVDEKWSLVERKHERSLLESRSNAWTSSLLNLHANRKHKNDGFRLQLVAELEKLLTGSARSPLDTYRIKEALTVVGEEITNYREILAIKRRQTEFAGDYGEINNEK